MTHPARSPPSTTTRDRPSPRSTQVALLIAAVLLGLPGHVSAAPQPLSASDLDLGGGVAAEGALRVLELLDPPSAAVTPGEADRPGPAFTLAADQLTVETVTRGLAAGAGADGPRAESDSFHSALVTGTQTRVGFALAVLPVPGQPDPIWSSTGSCAWLRPGQASVHEIATPTSGPAPASDVAGSVLWEECADAAWQVRGDFDLFVWQWDGTIASDAREAAFWSGHRTAQTTHGLPLTHEALSGADITGERHLVFHATAGELSLDAFHGSGTVVHLREPTAHLQGHASLYDVVGSDAGGARGSGDRLEVRGALVITAGLATDRIPLRVEGGNLGALSPSGMSSLAADPLVLAWWSIVALLALAVAMGLARRRGLMPRNVTPSMQEEAWSLFSHAETLVVEGRFRKARRLLNRAVRLDGTQPDFHALRARCRSALGDLMGARQDHRHAHDGFARVDSASKASNALEAARTSSLCGRKDEAIAWLGLAAGYDPSCIEDAWDMPELFGLVGSTNRPQKAS